MSGTRRSAPSALLCVYRASGVVRTDHLARRLVKHGWRIGLWALDEVAPRLDQWTVGAGHGGKFDLINRALEALQLETDRHLVIVDDDIAISARSLQRLVDLGVRADLGLYQPAHSKASHASHSFCVRRALSVVRLTTFVEIGPVVVIAPQWRPRLAPFPAGLGMAWGLEVKWSGLVKEGCRLGIVDAVVVTHLNAPAATYDELDARAGMNHRLTEAGISSLADIQHELRRWSRWQRNPPWIA